MWLLQCIIVIFSVLCRTVILSSVTSILTYIATKSEQIFPLFSIFMNICYVCDFCDSYSMSTRGKWYYSVICIFLINNNIEQHFIDLQSFELFWELSTQISPVSNCFSYTTELHNILMHTGYQPLLSKYSVGYLLLCWFFPLLGRSILLCIISCVCFAFAAYLFEILFLKNPCLV